jgi:hypothetical protein
MATVVQRQTEHYVEISEQRKCQNRYGCGREVDRMCDTNHYWVHAEGYFNLDKMALFYNMQQKRTMT